MTPQRSHRLRRLPRIGGPQLDLLADQRLGVRHPADEPVTFDGKTYHPGADRVRLKGQLRRVYDLMKDGRWRTLSEIRAAAGGSEAAVSARLRDLRKERFGGYEVRRRRRGLLAAGVHEYQLVDIPASGTVE